MFETLFSWAFLPLGVVLGLAMAKRKTLDRPAPSTPGEPRLDMNLPPRTDTDPVDLQVTLGSLFRKRGDFDRAIQLHEAVLASSELTIDEAARARLELAQDFLRGGVMDRAEQLLLELVAAGVHLGEALELLLDLHEQGRDWQQAMRTAAQLQGVQGKSQARRIAHHHCEMAENARHDGDLATAHQRAEKALDSDHGCARASLLLASLAEAAKDWNAAIKAYTRAIEQDVRYLPEVLAPMQRCHLESDNADAYVQFLDDAEADHPDSLAVALAKADILVERGDNAQAYLASRLMKTPNWRGLLVWIDASMPGFDTASSLTAAYRKRLQGQPRYNCSNCGLKPGVLFWQCPSCKHWATIAPSKEDL